MDDAQGTTHGIHSGNEAGWDKLVKAHGGFGRSRFSIPAKNVQAFHGEAAKAGYFHGSRGHYLMRHKKHAPNEQFSEQGEDYLPPDATPVTMAGPVIAPLVQFREEVVEQFAEVEKGKAMLHIGHEPKEVDAEFHGPLAIHKHPSGGHILFHRKSGLRFGDIKSKKSAVAAVSELKGLPWHDEGISSEHFKAIKETVKKHGG